MSIINIYKFELKNCLSLFERSHVGGKNYKIKNLKIVINDLILLTLRHKYILHLLFFYDLWGEW